MSGSNSIDDVRTIACLHSSGGSGRQWGALKEYIGSRYDVLTPDLVGYGQSEFEYGSRFGIDDEVELVAGHIRAAGGKAHVVGHSYGGAVAIQVALRHPELVASLSVYEPVMFSLLMTGQGLSREFDEVERVADAIASQLDTIHGRWQGARDFINYWADGDAWHALENRQHARFASLMPKVSAEFVALNQVGTTARDLAAMQVPLRLVYGTATRKPALRIAELIAAGVDGVDAHVIDGVGHMAPVTHADVVNPMLVDHLLAYESLEHAAVA